MERINNIAAITDQYPDWQPNHIAFIKSMLWASGVLELVVYSQKHQFNIGWPDHSDGFVEIKLTFIDVRKLKLYLGGDELTQVMGFDIIDISTNAWEGINFEIEDYENGFISFYCREIRVDHVSGPVKLS